jgi:heme-degrading monooxygenase HmoA
MIAKTPEPPYYAVIFSSILTGADSEAYARTAARMVELAAGQPGFLGVESVRDGLGVTVSYWESLEAIAGWRRHAEHILAMGQGRGGWYAGFKVRIAKVERDYGFELDRFD